jgi:hypothetical protein
MKNNLHVNAILFKLTFLFTCFMLVIIYNKSQASEVSPSSTSKVAINFSNDTKKRELTIKVKANTAANLQLFLFSPEGTLVKEIAVSAQKITTIKSPERGYYLYECFNKDARMKSGSLIIK